MFVTTNFPEDSYPPSNSATRFPNNMPTFSYLKYVE